MEIIKSDMIPHSHSRPINTGFFSFWVQTFYQHIEGVLCDENNTVLHSSITALYPHMGWMVVVRSDRFWIMFCCFLPFQSYVVEFQGQASLKGSVARSTNFSDF